MQLVPQSFFKHFCPFYTPPSLFANKDGHREHMKQKPAQKVKYYCPAGISPEEAL